MKFKKTDRTPLLTVNSNSAPANANPQHDLFRPRGNATNKAIKMSPQLNIFYNPENNFLTFPQPLNPRKKDAQRIFLERMRLYTNIFKPVPCADTLTHTQPRVVRLSMRNFIYKLQYSSDRYHYMPDS